MAVVVMAIVQIRKCVLKLAGEAKVKIPDFPKETQNVENHCVSERFEINGEKFIFSFKCCPALKKEEEKKMMVSCAVCSPCKGVEMEMPVMYESVDTVVRTIDSEEIINKSIKHFEVLLHDVQDYDPDDDDRFDFDD